MLEERAAWRAWEYLLWSRAPAAPRGPPTKRRVPANAWCRRRPRTNILYELPGNFRSTLGHPAAIL